MEGRVEVFVNGSWGTVCDDYWDVNDAAVVCSFLGYTGRSFALPRYSYGRGEILMDNVQCTGSEASLEQCAHNGWGISNCCHVEDAGVRCNVTDERKYARYSLNALHTNNRPYCHINPCLLPIYRKH